MYIFIEFLELFSRFEQSEVTEEKSRHLMLPIYRY